MNYNLPANAYHQDFQVRARQNAGSGTCCDYWFFDDIVIPGTSGANLTTVPLGGLPTLMIGSTRVGIHQCIWMQ